MRLACYQATSCPAHSSAGHRFTLLAFATARHGRSLPARGLHLERAPFRGRVVEHAVDVGVAVFGAETLHRLERLVDDHAVGHVDAVLQFISRDAQHGTLDLVDFLDAAIEERLQRGVEFAPVLFDPRSEEHTSELQTLMSISYAVFCWKKKK